MSHRVSPVSEPTAIRLLLIAVAFVFLFLLIIIPVGTVFIEALSKGFSFYKEAILNEKALNAIKLTCLYSNAAIN